MRIHIVGSRSFKMTDDEFENLKAACRDIGREVARRRHEAVIGSVRPNTADRYVAEGMAEIAGKHMLTFYRRDDEISDKPDILTPDKFHCTIKAYKGNRHIFALAEGTAMLVIGGQGGTATAGFAAFALKRPVLALPRFGGAGKDL
jgi:hypothetical protein